MNLYYRYKDRIPSGLWLLIMLLGLVLVIAIPLVFIYVISHFEGISSIIFLVIGWFTFGTFARQDKRNPLIMGGAILFYALMGMAIDQPGNIIYNQPFALVCPKVQHSAAVYSAETLFLKEQIFTELPVF